MEDTVYSLYLQIKNSRFDSYTNLAKQHRQKEEVIFNKALDKTKAKIIECQVNIFDYEWRKYEFNDKYYGSDLVNKICQDLNIVEKQYFGLSFLSKLNSSKRWLKLDDKVAKVLEGRHNIILTFMFQYYPPNCEIFEDYMTVYYLIEQVKHDIRNKKIVCDQDLTLSLSAFYFYSRYGSYNREMFKHISRDIDMLVPEILGNKDMLRKFIRQYKKINNLTFIEADKNFIKIAMKLADYGVEHYKIMPLKNRDLEINISPNGITFCKKRKSHTIKWHQFLRCNEILGYLMISYRNENEKKKMTIMKTFDNKFFIDTIKQNEYVYKLLQKKNTTHSILAFQTTQVHCTNCPENHSSIAINVPTKNSPPPVPKRSISKHCLNDKNSLELQQNVFIGNANEYDTPADESADTPANEYDTPANESANTPANEYDTPADEFDTLVDEFDILADKFDTPYNCDKSINDCRKGDNTRDNDSWLHSDISSSGDESLSLHDGRSQINPKIRSVDVLSQKTLTLENNRTVSEENIQSDDEISFMCMKNNDFYDLNSKSTCDNQPNVCPKFAPKKFKSCLYPQKPVHSRNSVNSVINTSIENSQLQKRLQNEIKTFFTIQTLLRTINYLTEFY